MIIDSGIWNALKYQKDKYHNEAKKLAPTLLQNQINKVTDYIVLEVYAFLLRKANQQIAVETLQMFLNNKNIQIIYNTKFDFLESSRLSKKYTNLSLVDANILYHTLKTKIKRIMSFDSNFDVIKNVQRVY